MTKLSMTKFDQEDTNMDIKIFETADTGADIEII